MNNMGKKQKGFQNFITELMRNKIENFALYFLILINVFYSQKLKNHEIKLENIFINKSLLSCIIFRHLLI